MTDQPKYGYTPEQIAAPNTEHAHQAALFCWANGNLYRIPELKWLHAIPNGGGRDKATAARLKAEGVKAGVLDTFWPLPRGGRHGLYIEMKRPGLKKSDEAKRSRSKGDTSDEQDEFILYAEQQGYATAVCWSWIEAVQVIEDYYRS